MATPKVSEGRKPLSAKPKMSSMKSLSSDIFGNTLSLPPELEKELKDKGLIARWVSSKTLYANQGYHPKNWKPYKRDAGATMMGVEFKTGSDPDGLIRRGDCILATKSAEDHAKHQDWLDQKADKYRGYNKEQAAELRATARAAGAKTEIDAEYDSDDDEND